jgi:hypothetical protein
MNNSSHLGRSIKLPRLDPGRELLRRCSVIAAAYGYSMCRSKTVLWPKSLLEIYKPFRYNTLFGEKKVLPWSAVRERLVIVG